MSAKGRLKLSRTVRMRGSEEACGERGSESAGAAPRGVRRGRRCRGGGGLGGAVPRCRLGLRSRLRPWLAAVPSAHFRGGEPSAVPRPEASAGHHDAHGDKRYLRRSPHLARARPGHSARHGAFYSRRRLGGQGGGRPAHGGLAGRPCRAPFEAAAHDGGLEGRKPCRRRKWRGRRWRRGWERGRKQRRGRRRRQRRRRQRRRARLCRLLRHGRVLRGAVLRALGIDGLRHRALPLRPLGLAACALHAAGVLRGLRPGEHHRHRRCHSQGAAACAVMARCRPMRRDRRRLRAGGNRLHSNHRRRPAPHQAHLAELLPVGSPGRRAHGGAGHAVRLARVRRAPTCSPTRSPAAPAGGPSP